GCRGPRRRFPRPDLPRRRRRQRHRTVARTPRQQRGRPAPGDSRRLDWTRRDLDTRGGSRFPPDRDPDLLLPRRDRSQPLGVQLHPQRLPRGADGRYGPCDPPAPSLQALAATVGIVTLRGALPLDPNTILFPLFSGLFGLPTLIVTLRGPLGRIPHQRLESLRSLSRADARCALRGTAAGAAVSWLPGLSGGAAATLASVGGRKRSGPHQFMIVLGAVSSSTSLLSVTVLFIIHRTRSGTAAAVRDFLGDLAPWSGLWSTPNSLLAILGASVLATAFAAPLVVRLSRRIAQRCSTSNPRRISALSLVVIQGLLLVVTGPLGLGVAAIAMLVGLVP